MNSKLVKILVPVFMVLVVAGIWVFQSGILNGNSTQDPQISGLNVESEEDIEKIRAIPLPTIIDFGADECVPCVEMAPVLEKLNTEMAGKANINFVDVWKNPEAAEGYPVQVIPTQIFFNADGTPYVPTQDVGVEFVMYADMDTEEHIFTVHQGGLTEEQMLVILEDMGVE